MDQAHDPPAKQGCAPTPPPRAASKAGSDWGSTVIDPVLSKAGEPWQANVAYGKAIGASDAPDLGQRYLVQSEIAHGGMGTVFKGIDREVGRAIAIKILREKHQGNAELVRRFIEEAQITGQLQHPGVVPIYEIGYLSGNLPYFTMKLIEGHTLESLLRRRKNPRERLDYFIGVFGQVAQTIAFAHAKGVLHRDIKPHNVMVGEFGEVQVIDWGLAKVLGLTLGATPPGKVTSVAGSIRTIRTIRSGSNVSNGSKDGTASMQTKVGAIIGTPAYLAPEQARGEESRMGTPSDVFGLGSVLCEILTGMPPFAGATGMESCDKSCRADLQEAFGRLAQCGADAALVELALACLAPDPAGRLSHAGEVAARVAAYKETVGLRMREAEAQRVKAMIQSVADHKRRRMALFSAFALSLLVVGMAAGGLVWMRTANEWQVESARQKAQILEREVGMAQKSAALDRKQADQAQAVASAIGQAVGFMEAMNWPQARANLEQAKLLMGDSDESALETRLAAAQHDLDLAVKLDEIGLRCMRQAEGGRTVDAVDDAAYAGIFRGAGMAAGVENPETVAGRIRASAVRPALEAAVDGWAQAAVSPARQAWLWQVREKLGGGSEWAKWRLMMKNKDAAGVVAAGKAMPDASPQMLLALGNALRTGGFAAEGIELLRFAQDKYPADFWVNWQLGNALAETQPEDAVGFYRVALSLRPEVAVIHHHLGQALAGSGRMKEAEAAFGTAAKLDLAAAADHHRLGRLLKDGDRLKDAEREYREALELRPGLVRAHSGLALLLAETGRVEEARREYEEALELSPDVAGNYIQLVSFLAQGHHWKEALDICSHGLARFPKEAALHHWQGNVLGALRRDGEAVAAYKKAIALDPGMSRTYYNLGFVWARQGDYAKALEITEQGQAHENGPSLYSQNFADGYRRVLAWKSRLPAILAGQPVAAKREDFYALGEMCSNQSRFADAFALFSMASRAEPEHPDDGLLFHVRYNAACAAAKAAREPGLEPSRSAMYRRDVLQWMNENLKNIIPEFRDNRPGVRENAKTMLVMWIDDIDLSQFQKEAVLARLPADERRGWRDFWSACRRLLE